MLGNSTLCLLLLLGLATCTLIPCDCECNTSLGIIKKYVDYLPTLKVLTPDYKDRRVDKYSVRIKEIDQKVHRDLPLVPMYGYEGVYPGPIIAVSPNKKVEVTWANRLPQQPLIAINDTGAQELEDMLGIKNVPANRIVTHVHGGRTSNSSDGLPLEFYGPGYKKTYTYFNRQRPTLLLYHDHAYGITRVNVYNGLAGAWLIRDPKQEKEMNLPTEIPLIIQDKIFQWKTKSDDEDKELRLFIPFNWVPEILGDVILVNGKAWPYIEVEPRKYRLRIANVCDARYLNLRFLRETDNIEDPGVIQMIQIGGDQGFFDAPVPLTELLLAPAERADVIVDFSTMKSANLILFNNAPAPYGQSKMDPNQNVTVQEACSSSQIMKFRVRRCTFEKVNDVIKYEKLSQYANTPLGTPIGTRTHVLIDQGTKLLIDNKGYLEPPIPDDFVDFNQTYEWKYINCGPDNHPIHPHLVEFRIIEKRFITFDSVDDCINGNYVLGDTEPLDLNEALAWKDTVRVPPGMITTFRVRFEQYCGKYVHHCHITSHEDNDMMRNYYINGVNCLN